VDTKEPTAIEKAKKGVGAGVPAVVGGGRGIGDDLRRDFPGGREDLRNWERVMWEIDQRFEKGKRTRQIWWNSSHHGRALHRRLRRIGGWGACISGLMVTVRKRRMCAESALKGPEGTQRAGGNPRRWVSEFDRRKDSEEKLQGRGRETGRVSASDYEEAGEDQSLVGDREINLGGGGCSGPWRDGRPCLNRVERVLYRESNRGWWKIIKGK